MTFWKELIVKQQSLIKTDENVIILTMRENLLSLKNEALALILQAKSKQELESLRIVFLGKNGKLNQLLKLIPNLSLEEKKEIGKLGNEIKITIKEAIQNQTANFYNFRNLENEAIDITVPAKASLIGHLHPQTQVLTEVIDIFRQIGYQVADGPEIETDYYNFEALNIPKDHPARDTQQTLYLKTKEGFGNIILRTQTSAMQGRVMEKTKPPLRVIVPGKCYRYEQVDTSHGFEFWQLEGFCVDKNITLTDLFGTISYVLKKIMGQKTDLRFACTNFPFVEPGVDTYIKCSVCQGKGCSFCKYSGWSEIMPAGMIHPNVLKACKINHCNYQGFAFAIGLSRLVTLRYNMNDLRLLTTPDLRIINQF